METDTLVEDPILIKVLVTLVNNFKNLNASLGLTPIMVNYETTFVLDIGDRSINLYSTCQYN